MNPVIAIGAAGVIVGALLSGGAIYKIQELRVEAAVSRADTADGKRLKADAALQNAMVDLKNCTDAAAEQNAALEDARKRAALALAALELANSARLTADKEADDILQERTPPGQDKCTAARDAFADELRKERSQ